MASRVSMAARSELVEAIVERYRLSSRADEQRILDEFVAVTGYHRKHAIRVLRRRAKGSPPTRKYPVALWRRCSGGTDSVVGSIRPPLLETPQAADPHLAAGS